MIKRFINKLAQTGTNVKRTQISPDNHPVRVEDVSPFALEVADTLRDAGYDAYLVGGCVRDILLGKTPKDFDVATNATPEQTKRLFRRARIIGRRFQIVHVQNRQEIIEVTTFRGHHDKLDDSSKNRRRGEALSKQSGKGMLVRDNVFGSMEEDAMRRDFTCNALYFDADTEEVIDFVGGVADLNKGLLKTIGDPAQRFREDPVRMLRALRFQAKLGLKLDKNSQKELISQAKLIREVSAARLFDEVIKLLLHDKSTRAFQLFRESGLFAYLFPASAAVTDQNEQLNRLLNVAMEHTEARLGIGKGVSPFYLYATLLWPAVVPAYERLLAKKQPPARAIDLAASDILSNQVSIVSIPKRFSISMRETWHLQTQMHRRAGDRADRLMEHSRFRAAYDFILMREESGEDLQGLGAWWTDYQKANSEKRQAMLKQLGNQDKKRSHRRGGRRKRPSNSPNT